MESDNSFLENDNVVLKSDNAVLESDILESITLKKSPFQLYILKNNDVGVKVNY